MSVKGAFMQNPYPPDASRYSSPSIVEPATYIEYKRSLGQVPDVPPPAGVILCYQKSLMDYILSHHVSSSGYGFLHSLHWLKDAPPNLAIHQVVNAPNAVIKLEELGAMGVKKFIAVGTAGSLQPSISIGDLILCEKAIREDGVSHHYLPVEKYAYPSSHLTERLAACLQEEGLPYLRGASWTTSALYRETVLEVRQYQNEGILTVEMEAAALFSVAHYRGLDLAALLTISDDLSSLSWHPASHNESVVGGLEKLFKVAVKALQAPCLI